MSDQIVNAAVEQAILCCSRTHLMPAEVQVIDTGTSKGCWLCMHCGFWVALKWDTADPSRALVLGTSITTRTGKWSAPPHGFRFPQPIPLKRLRAAAAREQDNPMGGFITALYYRAVKIALSAPANGGGVVDRATEGPGDGAGIPEGE